jgi:metal-dependent amidase/aminoacylase/carboxypeptidase family protein
MTFLVGLAQRLQSQPPAKGKVLLCFQPAEETGEGALRMLQEPKFEAFSPDLVFAIHNLPGFPKHQILWKEGAFTAAVESMVIRLHGKTSHAAEPEQGVNPAWRVADILKVSKSLQQPKAMDKDFCLITPVHIAVGEKAYGVSPGYGELHYTLRTFDADLLNRKKRDLIQFIELKADKLGIDADIEENIEPFRANFNAPIAIKEVRKAASELGLSEKMFVHPLRWGEDFGEFTSRFDGALIGLGAGEHEPALHNPDYDFPDDLIETGINLFERMVRNKLS